MALISMNFDEVCTPLIPTVTQVFEAMTPLGYIFLSIATLLSIFTFLVFLDELFYIHIKVPYKTHKERLYWLIGIFPVFSLTSFLGICVPRSGVLVDFVASVYLSIAIFQFFQLIVEYFGGKASMLEILSDTPVPLNSPPLACCCPCLPRVPFVKKNFGRLKAIVFQTALVRPILIFIAAVLWTDGSYTPGQISLANAYLYLTILTSISTLLGMYGLVIMFRMSKHWLREHHLLAKFISIQLVLIFSNLQGSILEYLTTRDIIPCVAPFYTKTRGMELNHLLLVMECFILAVLLHHYYRKEALHGGPSPSDATKDLRTHRRRYHHHHHEQDMDHFPARNQENISTMAAKKRAAGLPCRLFGNNQEVLGETSPSFKQKMQNLKHAFQNNYIVHHHHKTSKVPHVTDPRSSITTDVTLGNNHVSMPQKNVHVCATISSDASELPEVPKIDTRDSLFSGQTLHKPPRRIDVEHNFGVSEAHIEDAGPDDDSISTSTTSRTTTPPQGLPLSSTFNFERHHHRPQVVFSKPFLPFEGTLIVSNSDTSRNSVISPSNASIESNASLTSQFLKRPKPADYDKQCPRDTHPLGNSTNTMRGEVLSDTPRPHHDPSRLEKLSSNLKDILLAPARKLTLVSVLMDQQHKLHELERLERLASAKKARSKSLVPGKVKKSIMFKACDDSNSEAIDMPDGGCGRRTKSGDVSSLVETKKEFSKKRYTVGPTTLFTGLVTSPKLLKTPFFFTKGAKSFQKNLYPTNSNEISNSLPTSSANPGLTNEERDDFVNTGTHVIVYPNPMVTSISQTIISPTSTCLVTQNASHFPNHTSQNFDNISLDMRLSQENLEKNCNSEALNATLRSLNPSMSSSQDHDEKYYTLNINNNNNNNIPPNLTNDTDPYNEQQPEILAYSSTIQEGNDSAWTINYCASLPATPLNQPTLSILKSCEFTTSLSTPPLMSSLKKSLQIAYSYNTHREDHLTKPLFSTAGQTT